MCKRFLLLSLIIILLFSLSFGQDFITFDSLIPLLQNSPIYKVYEAQYQNSLINYYSQKNSLNPKLSLQTAYNYTNEDKNGSISLSYSKILFPWGEIGIILKSSEVDLIKAQNNLRNNYRNLYYQLMQYFHNLYLSQEQLKLYEKSYNLAKRQREIAEKQFKDGLINEINLLNYRQREKLAEINYTSAKNTLEFNYKTLENLLGTKLPRILVKIDLNYDPIKDSPEDLLGLLYENNLTIKNAFLDLEQAKLGLEKAKLPSWNISLSGSYSIGNTYLGFSFDTQNYALNLSLGQSIGEIGTTGYGSKNLWNVKIVFSTPILDGGSKSISINQANISLRQAELNFQKTKSDVELNFWKLYQGLLQAHNLITQKEMILQEKKTNYEAQKIRCSLGLITELDLEAYELEVLQAEYDLISAILDYKLQRFQLDILLGK